jgi:hypothetical protein
MIGETTRSEDAVTTRLLDDSHEPASPSASLTFVLAQLGDLERIIPDDRRWTKLRRYVVTNQWVVRPEVLLKGLLSPHHHIVGIMAGKQSFKGCLDYLQSRQSLVSDSRADLINVRPHFKRTGIVRSFYISGQTGYSIKAWLPPWHGETSRENEVANRRRVLQIGRLNVPRILTHGLCGGREYLVEEFVEARLPTSASDRRHIADTLLPALREHYEASGITIVGVADYLGPAFCEGVALASHSIPWPAEWIGRTAFLDRIERLYNSGKALVCGSGHGDLNLSHVGIMQDGRITILDWESARQMPVAADLADLDRTCGNRERWFHDACQTTVNHLTRCSDVLSGTEQMALLALRRAGNYEELVKLRDTEGRTNALPIKLRNYLGYAQRLLAGGTGSETAAA